MDSSILLKNATLIDGSGSPRRSSDLLIRKGLIMSISRNISESHANHVIDLENNFVAPGFIDPVSSADQVSSILSDRRQESYLKNGITTLIVGHLGLSLAPVLENSIVELITASSSLNLNWGTFSDFRFALNKHRFGPNFYSLAGGFNISHPISHPESSALLASSSLHSGALGISFDLSRSNAIFPTAALAACFSLDRVASIFLPKNSDARRRLIFNALRERRKANRGQLIIPAALPSDLEYLKRSRAVKEAVLVMNPTSPIHALPLLKNPNVLIRPTLSLIKYALSGKRSLSLEELVAKLTSIPAQLLGLKNNHQLLETEPADLVIFDSSGHLKTVLVSGLPAISPAGIFPRHFLNGQAVFL